ncbi:MAG TPA: flagellin lysine-N-methylase [Clostridia bacterium]|nr:flagellin lysine-N-methylase [Clostridia bacterium]
MVDARDCIVPEYYPNFSCKCSQCTCTCCSTWSIPLSLSEYFKLLSIPCSEALRKQLDRAFRIATSPTPDRYAVIAPRYDGTCPMLMDDGLCMLQHECGAEELSSICRCYPRCARIVGDQYEAACANSCERTLELLFEMQKPLAFIHQTLPGDSFVAVSRDDIQKALRPIRPIVFQTLQNRAEPLSVRLMRLGRILSSAEHDGPAACTEPLVPSDAGIGYALDLQFALLSLLSDTSVSLGEEAQAIFAKFGASADGAVPDSAYYLACRAHLYDAFPGMDVYLEQLLANHLFFENFPFIEKYATLWHAYMALCAVYAVLKFIAACGMAEKSGVPDLIRIMTHAFRAIENSSFDHNAVVVLLHRECASQACLDRLVSA